MISAAFFLVCYNYICVDLPAESSLSGTDLKHIAAEQQCKLDAHLQSICNKECLEAAAVGSPTKVGNLCAVTDLMGFTRLHFLSFPSLLLSLYTSLESDIRRPANASLTSSLRIRRIRLNLALRLSSKQVPKWIPSMLSSP